MTRDEIIAEIERVTPIWQSAGDYLDRLRSELATRDGPAAPSLDDLRASMDSLVQTQAVAIANAATADPR